jgi:hypothetical protein
MRVLIFPTKYLKIIFPKKDNSQNIIIHLRRPPFTLPAMFVRY